MNKDFNWKNVDRSGKPFKVPEDYFDGFADRMMERIRSEENSTPATFSMGRMVKWVSGVAAVLLIGLIGLQQFHLKPQNQKIEKELLYSVIEYYAQDLDDVSFATLMAENEVLQENPSNSEADLLDYMSVDDLTLIEALLNGN